MNDATFRLTRKLGFGLRPGEPVPSDVVTWATAQLAKVPEQLGVAKVPLLGGAAGEGVSVAPWPEAYLLSLERLVSNAVEMKKANVVADKKFGGDGARWGEYMDAARKDHHTLNWDSLRRSHQPVYGQQPVFDRFSFFWANHFTVGANNEADVVFAHYFADAINANLVKDFASLLYDVTTHPAMQNFLDGPYSIGPKSRLGRELRAQGKYADINENLGRELLELHTLSPAAGYTQADIIGVAKILTGRAYTIQLPQKFPSKERWKVFFSERHEPGPKQFMGIEYPEGKDALRQLTDFLAGHNATILFISRKLAKHFVADEPTEDDVQFIANAWREADGHLPAIHRAVIERAVAREPARKFQMPEVWLYQMLRSSGANLFNGWEQTSYKNDEWMLDGVPRSPRVLLDELGQSYWVVRQPNGYSEDRNDWISPEYLDRRLRYAQHAFTAGMPVMAVDELMDRMQVEDKTRILVERGKSAVDKFVLLFCSPEMMEA